MTSRAAPPRSFELQLPHKTRAPHELWAGAGAVAAGTAAVVGGGAAAVVALVVAVGLIAAAVPLLSVKAPQDVYVILEGM